MIKNIRLIKISHFKAKWLIYILLFSSIFFSSISEVTKMPSFAKYLMDLLMIFLCLVAIKRKIHLIKFQRFLCAYIFMLFWTCVITYLFNYQSVVFFLYGIAYKFRYYLFIVLCFYFLNDKDVKNILNVLEGLFYINAFVVLVQYKMMGLYGDNLGGIFGTNKGCNAYLNIFLIVTIAISILNYLDGEKNFLWLIFDILVCFGIAALSELKFYFLEFVVLLLIAFFYEQFTWRKFWLVVISALGLFAGFFLFSKMYSTYANSFLNLDTWIKAATSNGYSAGYSATKVGIREVNRLTFVSVLNESALKTPASRLFGLGVGNCSFSGMQLLNTPFYHLYADLKYEWFSSSYIYIESGWIGLILFEGFFVFLFILSSKLMKIKFVDPKYCYLCKMMSMISIMILLYNNSLTMDSAFLFYFVAAIPFIMLRKNNK